MITEDAIFTHLEQVSFSRIWPESYGLDLHHCRDVLMGCYDVPYEPKVILDLGANVGAFARWANRRWPQATIHSYEPHPVNFSLLKQTLTHFSLSGVHIHEKAISDKNGRHLLYDNGFNCGEWSLTKIESSKGNIEVESMDAAELPEADFIKMDTEGAELLILLRLFTVDKLKSVNSVVLEYHSSSVIEKIQDLMRHCGFKLFEKRFISEHRGIMKFTR